MIDYSLQKDKAFILTENGKIKQVFITDIVYIECDSYLSTIHLSESSEKEKFCKLLKELEGDLNDYGFLRISRNILLNMKYLKEINTKNDQRIILKNGTELSFSGRKLNLIKQFFEI